MDKEMIETLRAMFREEIKSELEPIKVEISGIRSELATVKDDIKEIKSDVKEFKDQFSDFEAKSATNHVEVLNKIESMKTDLNTIELVTSKNWNDIVQLKAVK